MRLCSFSLPCQIRSVCFLLVFFSADEKEKLAACCCKHHIHKYKWICLLMLTYFHIYHAVRYLDDSSTKVMFMFLDHSELNSQISNSAYNFCCLTVKEYLLCSRSTAVNKWVWVPLGKLHILVIFEMKKSKSNACSIKALLLSLPSEVNALLFFIIWTLKKKKK